MSELVAMLMAQVPDERRVQALQCAGFFADKPQGPIDPVLAAQKLAMWLHENQVTESELRLIVKELDRKTFAPGVAAFGEVLAQIRPSEPSEFERRFARPVEMRFRGDVVLVPAAEVDEALKAGYEYPSLAVSGAVGREQAVAAGKRALLALSSRIPDVDEDHGAKVFEELRRNSC